MNDKENVLIRLRSVRSADEWCNIVDNATPAERLAIRAELQQWQRIAKEGEAFYARASRRWLAVAMIAAAGLVASVLAMVASIG